MARASGRRGAAGGGQPRAAEESGGRRRPGAAARPGGRPLLPARDTLLVVAAAIALRVLYWALYSRTPLLLHPVIDGSFFDLWGQAIAAGRNFQPDVYFKPPLYAFFVGGIYRLLGHAPLAIFALQMLMGVAGSVLVLAIGRLVFTPRIARVGALAAALLPILPFLEMQLVAEALTTFLSLAALLLLLLARGEGGRWSGWRLGAAGLLLGVAAVGRPNGLLLLPAAAWWVWRESRGGIGGAPVGASVSAGGARRWRPAALVLAAGVAALVPSTLRNLSVGGVLVPVSANLGVNLWTGHGPDADGVSAIPVGVHWDDLQLRCRQAGAASAAASSSYLTRQTLREMAARPGRALGLLAKKALVLVNAQEVRNNIGPSFLAREEGVVPLARWWPGFWLLGPPALLGLIGARRWGAPGRLLWLYLAALALSTLPFFVCARFRAPLLPVAALFAAAAVDDVVTRLRGAGPRAAAAPLALLAGLFVLVNVDWFRLDNPRQAARDHFNLAMAFSSGIGGGAPGAGDGGWRAADPAAAREHFERAVALDPDEADFADGYGQYLLKLAEPLVTRAAALRDGGGAAQATALEARTRPLLEQALAQTGRAARLFPRAYRSLANAGVAQLWLGDADAAAGSAQSALARYREAADDFSAALRVDPTFRTAADNLAQARSRLPAGAAP